MLTVKEIINLLGRKATDKVTGQKGVITSVCFDLYGCTQAIINPGVMPDGKLGEICWFDISRLEVADDRVMRTPEFRFADAPVTTKAREKGPESKPAFR